MYMDYNCAYCKYILWYVQFELEKLYTYKNVWNENSHQQFYFKYLKNNDTSKLIFKQLLGFQINELILSYKLIYWIKRKPEKCYIIQFLIS